MPTRVLLEGPAIEPLLAQVREEYGTHAKIISADKVRSGGVAGFFTKQKYELSVEIPDDAPTPDDTDSPERGSGSTLGAGSAGGSRPGPAAGTPGPGLGSPAGISRSGAGAASAGPDTGRPAETLEQLLARVESQDTFAADGEAPSPVTPAGATTDRPPFTPAAGFAGLAAAVEPGLPPRASMLSTNGAAFAEVMAGLGHAPPTGEPRNTTPEVRPFRPQTAAGTPVNAVSSVPASTGRRNPYVDDALISDLTSTAAALLDASTRAKTQETAAPQPAAPQPAAPAQSTPATAPAPQAPATTHAPATTPAPQAPATPSAPAALGRGADVAAPAAPHPMVQSLLDLGLPAELAARIEGADAYSGVLQALKDLPAAPEPPDRPGDVLVIAGEIQHALPVARQVVAQLGLDEQQLLLAGRSAAGTGIHASRRIDTPEDAERRARRMHRADAAHVVVVDAPVSGLDAPWVRDICDALGATAVWAVVDATRKTGDTSRHLAGLGDVEAIVVHGVADTADPATVLGLDLPIVSLDGRPATRRGWAALICERLTADIDTEPPGRRRRRIRER